jgi:hypothetical protein
MLGAVGQFLSGCSLASWRVDGLAIDEVEARVVLRLAPTVAALDGAGAGLVGVGLPPAGPTLRCACAVLLD